MKDFFEDIFKYHNHFNQLLADQFEINSHQISDRSIPLFSHMLNAHQIWNSRILHQPPFGVNDVHDIPTGKKIDNHNLDSTLKILENFSLDTVINYKNTKGVEFQNSISEILFHVINHHTHHRGQLISDLRQVGIEPLVTDYIFYKRK